MSNFLKNFNKTFRLSGLSPFVGENDFETMNNVNSCEFSFNYQSFADVSEQAKDFIRSLLQKQSKKRLTAEKAKNHPWITSNTQYVEPKTSQNPDLILSVTKTKLKRYVIRKRWIKATQAILALRRMGARFD